MYYSLYMECLIRGFQYTQIVLNNMKLRYIFSIMYIQHNMIGLAFMDILEAMVKIPGGTFQVLIF